MLLRRSVQPRRAATSVEFALVCSVFALFLFALFEWGHYIMVRHLVNNAVREGARQAAVNSSFSYDPATQTFAPQTLATTDIQNTVLNYLATQQLNSATTGQPLQASDVQVIVVDPTTCQPVPGSNWNGAQFEQGVAVSLNCTYTPILPGLGFLTNNCPITITCVMGSEAN
jgi:Flp pilus assembly protein TadG